jgi:hypothetical protein
MLEFHFETLGESIDGTSREIKDTVDEKSDEKINVSTKKLSGNIKDETITLTNKIKE